MDGCTDNFAQAEAMPEEPKPAQAPAADETPRPYPSWRRWFGAISVLVAIGTAVLVARFAWESWLDALLYLAMKSLAGEDTGQELPALLLRNTLFGWVVGVCVSMVVLLIAGIAALSGRQASWALHRMAAGLILVATLGTFVALSIWIHYGAAEPQQPATYAWLAIGQSAWAWISLAAFARQNEYPVGRQEPGS